MVDETNKAGSAGANPPGAGFPDFTESNESQGGGAPRSKLDAGTPAVGASPGKAMGILAILIIGAATIIWLIFGGDDPPPESNIGKRSTTAAKSGLQAPQLPAAPIDIPPPTPAPPIVIPPPSIPQRADVEVANATPDESARRAREQAQSVVFKESGSLFGSKKPNERDKLPEYNDPNSAFMANAIRSSEAETSLATTIGGLGHTIAQGKVIDCVLETAINTDLPGTIRAIVSHDIYAEHGRDVLIPRGARLIGTYNTGVTRGQNRVFIVWTRMIRPDGVDIQLGSPGVDQLGRAGVKGDVDNKFFEIFTSAILTSAIAFGGTALIEAVSGDDGSTTTRRTFTDGSIETAGDPSAIAASQFAGNFYRTGRELVDSLLNVNPTITIPQGTVMKVFVNRDLIFAPETHNRGLIIP